MPTSRHVSACLAVAVVCSLALGSPRGASAQSAADVETARAYFAEATRLGKVGRWKEARELYARSLALKPNPITRYSLGVAQRETGRLAEALASFRAFLDEPSTPSSAPFTEPARAAITALEARIGYLTLVVTPAPVEGLTLVIDGQPAPALVDLPRDIEPGPHEIVARAPGFQQARAWFFVKVRASTRVALTLTPTATDGRPVVPVKPAEPPPPPAPSRALPIALMGVGGGLIIGGVAVGLVGVSQASRAPTRDGPEARSAHVKGVVGDVVAVTGIATAGVGLVLLLTRGSGKKTAGGALAPWASGSVVGVEARF